jgi:hypothetical protein
VIVESERDQAESSFTRLIREFLDGDPRYLAGIFVDREGECVDYCARLDAFDAKVAGAHLQVVLGEIRPSLQRLSLGEPRLFAVFGSERDLVLRRVDAEYSFVLVATAGSIDDDMFVVLSQLAHDLRAEAMLPPAHFEDQYGPLEVEVRESVGFPFAPTALRVGELQIEIADVLGHFREEGGLPGGILECFHVRDIEGNEFLLAYDDGSRRWHKRQLGS